MRWQVDPRDPRPIYQQIAASVRMAIDEGVLGPGDRLPAARVLAASLEVNLHTVLQAYQGLRDEGCIELRRGRGAVVVARPGAPGRLDTAVCELIAQARACGLSTEDLIAFVQEKTND